MRRYHPEQDEVDGGDSNPNDLLSGKFIASSILVDETGIFVIFVSLIPPKINCECSNEKDGTK